MVVAQILVVGDRLGMCRAYINRRSYWKNLTALLVRKDCKECDSAENPMNASTKLSMNGKSPTISTAPPFVLRLSKDERRVFQQNRVLCLTSWTYYTFLN